MIKVLLIESMDDEITSRRHHYLSDNHLLSGYEVDFFYAMDPFSEMSETNFYNRLIMKINDNQPDYILIHTGIAFISNMDIYNGVFNKIQLNYPDIGIGIQNKEYLDIDFSVFNRRNEKVIELENLFFNKIFEIGDN